jgi:diphthine synthase
MAFYLIGLGLKPKDLGFEAFEAIKKCNYVYLESYTSHYAEGTIKDLQEIVMKKIQVIDRKTIEENFSEILESARNLNVCLLVFGDPLIATTHNQILLDCKKKGIKTKIIHGLSVLSLLGETGLETYKFGRTTSIVFQTENYKPDSFYEVIKRNYENNLHTLCLLDIDYENKKFMSAKEAIQILKKIDFEKGNFLQNKVVLAFAALGSSRFKICGGRFSDFDERLENTKGFNDTFPQSLIVCARLSDKEKEFLEKIHGITYSE